MANNVEIVRNCITAVCNICPTIDRDRFIRDLSSVNEEANFITFYKFAGLCKTTLLGLLFASGLFENNPRIHNIAAEIIQIRRSFEEDEEDVKGVVERLLQHSNSLSAKGKKRKAEEPAYPEQGTSRSRNNEDICSPILGPSVSRTNDKISRRDSEHPRVAGHNSDMDVGVNDVVAEEHVTGDCSGVTNEVSNIDSDNDDNDDVKETKETDVSDNNTDDPSSGGDVDDENDDNEDCDNDDSDDNVDDEDDEDGDDDDDNADEDDNDVEESDGEDTDGSDNDGDDVGDRDGDVNEDENNETDGNDDDVGDHHADAVSSSEEEDDDEEGGIETISLSSGSYNNNVDEVDTDDADTVIIGDFNEGQEFAQVFENEYPEVNQLAYNDDLPEGLYSPSRSFGYSPRRYSPRRYSPEYDPPEYDFPFEENIINNPGFFPLDLNVEEDHREFFSILELLREE